MKYPLIAPLAAFSAGIVAGEYAAFSLSELAPSILLLLALTGLGLWRRLLRAASMACCAGFLLAGALWPSLAPAPGPANAARVVDRLGLDLRRPVALRGWVREPPVARPDRDQFVLAVETVAGIPAEGGVRVTVARRPGQFPLDLEYGTRVEIPARLRRLRNYENPGGFDRVGYQLRNEIHLTGSVSSRAPWRILEGKRGSRFAAGVWRARSWAARRLDSLLQSDRQTAGVARAMLLGDASALDPRIAGAFRRTSTYHVLVVSGSNVALVAGLALVAFRRLRIPAVLRMLLTLALAVAFVLLVGSQLPAVRAALMVGAYLLARQIYRQRRPLNVVAAAAFALLLFDPRNLFDVSFQLSFLAVALIAGIAVPVLEQTLEPYRLALLDLPNVDRDMHLPPKVAQTRIEWRMLAERLALSPRFSLPLLCGAVRAGVASGELVAVSAIVQLGLVLPMAVYFHHVSWSGLSANLLAVPLLSLIVPLGLLAIGSGWTFAGQALAMLVSALITVVEWHARLEWLEIRTPSPPAWYGVLCGAALIALAWTLSGGRRFRILQAGAGAALLAALAILIWHPFAPRLEPGRFELTALDVGQGEALLLVMPAGQTMLLDAGGLAAFGRPDTPSSFDIGQEVVAPYLWSRSIRRLDVLAVSHAHTDHIGGLPAVLENFPVRELWTGPTAGSPEWNRALEIARRRGVKLVELAAGDARQLGGVAFEVLAPPRDHTPRRHAANEDSLVLLASFGERRFLLSGDMERRSERRLLEAGVLPPVDVLKVAHHGSRTSTSEMFLEATRPWLAVISAGYDNSYGHPHPDVVARLAARRSSVRRTDRDGLVSLLTDGHRVTVSWHALERRSRRPTWEE